MKYLTALVIVLFAIILLGVVGYAIIPLTIEAGSQAHTQTVSSVVTEPAETTATYQLASPLYKGDLNYVSIVSSNASDIATPESYDTNTRALGIAGLVEDDTRNLEITYRSGVFLANSGAEIGLAALPTIFIIAIAVIALLATIGVVIRR
jgi:hypothetical protein